MKKLENVLEINDIESNIWKVKFKGRRLEDSINTFTVRVVGGEPAFFEFGLIDEKHKTIGKLRRWLKSRWFRFRHPIW
jgi:hypothetical protein